MVVFHDAPVDNGRVSPHKHRITDYLRPKTLAMLLLGFSSGLPFLLVGNTFGYWLRDEHTALTAIGFLSWVGIAYSLKFLWAPVMDRVDLPLFKRLGHRRGWMMFSQILVGLALCAPGWAGSALWRSSSRLPHRHRILWSTPGELNRQTTEKNKAFSRLPISSATELRSWLRIPLFSSWQPP